MASVIDKKVYIFGAGASAAVKLPVQNNLIQAIFSIRKPKLIDTSGFMDSFDNMEVMLIKQYNSFEISRRILSRFIIQNYGNTSILKTYMDLFPKCEDDSIYLRNDDDMDNKWEIIYKAIQDIDLSLEDLFTLMDKASLLKEYFINYSVQDIENIQEQLNFSIVYALSNATHNSKSLTLYDELANYFVKKRTSCKQSDDPFSIITLNWDTLLDKHIYNACIEFNKTSKMKTIYPDYCCYNYDINSIMPSFHIKAKGNYNIKLMKLHGSINWLICNNCGRLYTDYSSNISLQYVSSSGSIKCNTCNEHLRKYELKRMIITPTYIKAFNNLHLKNIWHNAYLDICDAKELVFIGYSFPDADFELRYILKKAVRQGTRIKVILHETDNPEFYNEFIKKNIIAINKQKTMDRLSLPEKRYNAFFSGLPIEFHYNGMEKAFTENLL